MSSPNQLQAGATFRSQRAVPFAQRAVQQYLGCLAVTGRLDTLEDCFRKFNAAGDGLATRYQMALALALGQQNDDALDHLRPLIAADPDHTNARKLAYRLLVHKAQQKSKAQDWVALAEVVTEALRLSPPGTDAATEPRTPGRKEAAASALFVTPIALVDKIVLPVRDRLLSERPQRPVQNAQLVVIYGYIHATHIEVFHRAL